MRQLAIEMREYIASVVLLTLLLSFVLAIYQSPVYRVQATPTGLVLASPAASLLRSETRNNTQLYVLLVKVPPLSISSERIACLYGASILAVNTTTGKISFETTVDTSCMYFTLDNPSLKEAEAIIFIIAETKPKEESQPLLPLLVGAVGVAAASYLIMTENGRDKLFKAISIPISYYVTRHEDVLRSEKRVKILEYLEKEPGASMRRIARDTGVSFGEVQWHLAILERLGYVYRVKIGKWTVYYPTGSPAEKWLANFVAKELGEEISLQVSATLASKLEPYISIGTIPINLIRENLAKVNAATR